jgi:hypothetical protein
MHFGPGCDKKVATELSTLCILDFSLLRAP